jgi:CheY-like chemotaxis protein
MPTKILAIDDSKTMRLAIKITFAAEDADVTSVSKGSEAVARAKQMAADVVLVDAQLAGGEPSGYDVCQQLKGDPATAGIPVILLVSGQTGVDQGKLKASGANGWIAKPFDTQELIDKVGEAVGAGAQAAASGARAVAGRPAAAARAPQTPAPRAATKQPAATAAARPAAAASSPAASRGGAAGPRAVESKAAASVPTASRPAATAAASRPTPAPARPLQPGEIPIAIPIPFTSADAPTPGILARLAEAGNHAGLDPRVAEALVAISKEVIEQVVWEVVPDLAEQILKQQNSAYR